MSGGVSTLTEDTNQTFKPLPCCQVQLMEDRTSAACQGTPCQLNQIQTDSLSQISRHYHLKREEVKKMMLKCDY